jgi:hypothetical protein
VAFQLFIGHVLVLPYALLGGLLRAGIIRDVDAAACIVDKLMALLTSFSSHLSFTQTMAPASLMVCPAFAAPLPKNK